GPENSYGITLRATAERADDNLTGPRLPGVTVWAMSGGAALRQPWIQSPGWRIWEYLPGLRQQATAFPVIAFPEPERIWLAPSVATALGVQRGDRLTLQISKSTDIPRESLLGRRGPDDTTQRITATVFHIAADDFPPNDFSLAPGIQRP